MLNNYSYAKAKGNRDKILDYIDEFEKTTEDIEGVDKDQLRSKRYRHP